MLTPEVIGAAASQSEEIKKIARKYADEVCPHEMNTRQIVFNVATAYHEWLSKTHCIVPKSKVKDEYEFAMLLQHSNHKADQDYGSARETLLETLFGTELFNEEKG